MLHKRWLLVVLLLSSTSAMAEANEDFQAETAMEEVTGDEASKEAVVEAGEEAGEVTVQLAGPGEGDVVGPEDGQEAGQEVGQAEQEAGQGAEREAGQEAGAGGKAELASGGEAPQQTKEPGRECSSGAVVDGEAAELSVESGHNTTGHWLAKVRLQHMSPGAGPEGEGQREPVQLQVRRWARRGGRQGDARLVTLQATLTGPAVSSNEGLPWNDWSSSCPPCPRVPSSSDQAPLQTSCPPRAPCPTCPDTPPLSPHPACPSPCPAPCPPPAPCPACPLPPTPEPIECPAPCATPPPCPNCPSCPACAAPPACPSPCPAPPPCPACPSCSAPTPPGYERHSGYGAYRLHLCPLNWFDAQATCEREGAHLAVINSQSEADILSRIIRKQSISIDYILVGFHDLYSEGSYYTVLDKPLHSSGYHKWRSGEPNNDGNEDCGGLYVDVMGFNDHRCHVINAPFICEMP